MFKNIKEKIKKTIRKWITFESFPKLFWFHRALRLAFSSLYNTARNQHEKEIAEEFHNYLSRLSKKERQDLIDNLKKDQPLSGQQEIEQLLFRQEYILRHNLLEQKKLWSEQELEEQRICAGESKKIRKKIKKFHIKTYSSEAFYGLSGLRWLPDHKKTSLENGIFLDIGAYDGDSSLAFYYRFRPEKIYALEPEENNFQRLKENCRILKKDTIIPVKSGVSDKKKKAFLSQEDTNSKIKNNNRGEEIEITTIDNFVEKERIKKVDLIKMDIEGEETNAILGAENTIKKNKPILAISIYHRPEDFFKIKSELEKLVPEYKFIIKKANPFSLTHEIMLLAYV
jgi:FkbM family methyltransferase